MKKVVFTHGGGRTGNQLLNHIHLFSFWKEHKDDFSIANLSFRKYAREYYGDVRECWMGTQGVDPIFDGLLRLVGEGYDQVPGHKVKNFWNTARCVLLHSVASVRPDAQSLLAGDTIKQGVPGTRIPRLNLDTEEDVEKLRSKSLTLLGGWGVRCWKLLEKRADEIRPHLRLDRRFMDRAELFMNEIRSKATRVIGVQIRQSDYQTWENGRYFFPTQQYAEWMRKFDLEHEGRTVFVVASEVPQEMSDFDGVECRFTTGIKGGDGHYLESFAEIAMCDAVMTPPSTFSTLAAFVGNNPIIPLHGDIRESGFEILHDNLFDAVHHSHMSKAVR